jgi:hypothetical protein
MPITRLSAALCDAMRNFFNSHWKVIVAILLAIVLATMTVETKSDASPLAARLQTHVQALAPDAPHSALRHVETSLRRYGYAPQTQQTDSTTQSTRSIEASVTGTAQGNAPNRTFIIGVHVGPGPGADVGTAAVLEVARAVKDLQPMPGTAIRFVFFMNDVASFQDGDVAAQPHLQSFMAFIGTLDASQRVRHSFAALRSDPMRVRHGLATSAHVMGLSLSDRDGQDGATTLLITGSGFLGYPYFNTAPTADPTRADAQDRNDYDALARVVSGLVRTLEDLAGVVYA